MLEVSEGQALITPWDTRAFISTVFADSGEGVLFEGLPQPKWLAADAGEEIASFLNANPQALISLTTLEGSLYGIASNVTGGARQYGSSPFDYGDKPSIALCRFDEETARKQHQYIWLFDTPLRSGDPRIDLFEVLLPARSVSANTPTAIPGIAGWYRDRSADVGATYPANLLLLSAASYAPLGKIREVFAHD